MNEKIFELIDQKAVVDKNGPKDLTKLFKFQGKGNKSGKKNLIHM